MTTRAKNVCLHRISSTFYLACHSRRRLRSPSSFQVIELPIPSEITKEPNKNICNLTMFVQNNSNSTFILGKNACDGVCVLKNK